ncbi:hypothetical protein [Marimonas arenosa]|uniref:Cytochrome c n=1 Tax=Marimonas arenosa TaxID=1795305 RepID=A0AAE3WHC0_9RHOB|nr:hypothetical protein [Marimonas arenosa]MDQ2091603.1 hypothetical protein [Marimonas arenosa]
MSIACKAGWAVSAVLAAALGAGAYLFVIQGNTEPYEDGRTAILLSKDERNRVLGEMRALLEASKAITQAAVKGDMETVATEARAVGMVAAEGESPVLIAKLPLEFMTMGYSAHRAMDDLADLAGRSDDPLEILGALGEAMEICTGCHAGYRLGVEGQDEGS